MAHSVFSSVENSSDSKKVGITLLLKYLRKELSIKDLDKSDAIHLAGQAVRILLPTKPKVVKELAYKKLNVYPFKDVPLSWRRVYEEACLWQILTGLERIPPSGTGIGHFSSLALWTDESVRLCDQAIIFTGAPRRRSVIDVILEWIELEGSSIALEASEDSIKQAETHFAAPKKAYNAEEDRSRKRRRLSDGSFSTDAAPKSFPASDKQAIPAIHKACEVERQRAPSLAAFEQHVRNAQTPLVISEGLNHWPAVKRWQNPQYWLEQTLNGRRLVPIELGKSYVDAGWGQQIMSFKKFLHVHLLDQRTLTAHDEHGRTEIDGRRSGIGYLAQHDLLSQIPALRHDIAVPDYCYINTTELANAASAAADHDEVVPPSDPQLNIWLGPANTISPAHTDPHHNILAQVFGRKYIRLFAPSQTEKMYPMAQLDDDASKQDDTQAQSDEKVNNHGVDMGNTSSMDVGCFVSWNTALEKHNNISGYHKYECSATSLEERQKFPAHENAQYFETILEAGECLYIPRGWWHYIRSLEPSCNVSFWWD